MGNILWNIAPDRNGKLSDEIHMRIHEFGTWIRQHGEAIYGTRGGPVDPVDKVFGATFRENIVYLHILDPERFSGMPIHLPGKVLSAQPWTEPPFAAPKQTSESACLSKACRPKRTRSCE